MTDRSSTVGPDGPGERAGSSINTRCKLDKGGNLEQAANDAQGLEGSDWMDIAGAKALKERLGHNAKTATPAAPADVSQDAPPVYHFLGVSETPPETPSAEPGEGLHERPRSLLRRLRWIFR